MTAMTSMTAVTSVAPVLGESVHVILPKRLEQLPLIGIITSS